MPAPRSAARKPAASSPAARERMSAQRVADTGIELALRRRLHAAGLRYRLHARVVPGTRRTVDIVFGPARLAVFADGCFWHACPEHGTRPAANGAWWADKLAATVARDRNTDERLRSAGWQVLRIWEHEDPDAATGTIVRAISARLPPARVSSHAPRRLGP